MPHLPLTCPLIFSFNYEARKHLLPPNQGCAEYL